MPRISTWSCELCDDEKAEGEAYRVRFVRPGKAAEGGIVPARVIQLCPLSDEGASARVICVACRELLKDAQEKK